MKNKLLKILRRLPVTLILLLSVSLGLAFLGSGCSSTADAAKGNKSKKSNSEKSAKNADEKEKSEAAEEEKSENSDSNAGEKESEKPLESEKHASDKKSAEKKDEKQDEKDSKHSKKVKTEKNAGAERIWLDLMKGNEQYVGGKHSNSQYISSRKQLVKAQKPEVIVLGCADSRVPPELVFDKNLGELFVVRDAGNITDLTTLGSIEYAVEHLHSKVLVILGHESCGAVAAAVSNEEMPSKNLAAIVSRITPAFEDSKTCPLGGKMNNSCVELNIRQSAKDVLLNSSIIKKAVDKGELTIIRAIYRLESGRVERLE